MVRDENDRDILLAAELFDNRDDLLPPLRVQHRGRLVEHNGLGLHRKNARNCHALLLPAGKKVRRMLFIREHSDRLQSRIHTAADFLRCNAEIFRGKGDVFFDDV